MNGLLVRLRSRMRDALAVAAGLLATGMLRLAPILQEHPLAAVLGVVGEQFANWLLLCLAVVAIITACESALAPGWRRWAVQAPCLAVAAPLYAAAVAASGPLTTQLRSLGIAETQGLVWYVAWFGWAIGALLSWYYRALEISVRAGTGLQGAERERQQAQRSLLESRLKVLEAQVEPRFLLDTLARVQSLYASDPPHATRTLDDLIDYLRAALPQLRERASTLGREMALVRAYLRIVSTRPAHVDPVDPALEDAYAPPMVLLPAVQMALGAVKPGVATEAPLELEAGVESGSARLFFRVGFDAALEWDPAPDVGAIGATLGLLFGAEGKCTISRAAGRASVRVAWPAGAAHPEPPSPTPPTWRNDGKALGNPA